MRFPDHLEEKKTARIVAEKELARRTQEEQACLDAYAQSISPLKAGDRFTRNVSPKPWSRRPAGTDTYQVVGVRGRWCVDGISVTLTARRVLAGAKTLGKRIEHFVEWYYSPGQVLFNEFTRVQEEV